MPMALSSLTCVMSSEGPESTDIDLEQAQQKSASILNVLRTPLPADISVECTNVLIIHVLTPTIHVVWRIAEAFLA